MYAVGQQFGLLTITGEASPYVSPKGRSQPRCLCLCECGVTKAVLLHQLRSGKTTSCGCAQRAVAKARFTKHAHSADGRASAEYKTWGNMIQRCHNDKNHKFEDYGARGIKVCAAWRDSFEQFLADMGPRPSPRHSIDRKDNDGNYEPLNCRWATAIEQRHNRHDSKKRA